MKLFFTILLVTISSMVLAQTTTNEVTPSLVCLGTYGEKGEIVIEIYGTEEDLSAKIYEFESEKLLKEFTDLTLSEGAYQNLYIQHITVSNDKKAGIDFYLNIWPIQSTDGNEARAEFRYSDSGEFLTRESHPPYAFKCQ
ncbi:MAG: hypothetical protein JNM93_11065 [Bacteriovoracaceae bacterium]|nr:hypothetical protein [Bacteriovoracaceae bacterium]